MSTVHHTPPSSGARPSHPAGFNDHAYYDPFFPSSPSEEHLNPLSSEPSPSHHSYNSPSPPQILKPDSNDLPTSNLLANTYSHPQLPSQSAPTSDFQSSYTLHPNYVTEFTDGLLSPNAFTNDGYSASSEHTATPDFSGANGFYLEEDYGMLIDPNQDMNSHDPNSLLSGNLSAAHTDIDSPYLSNYTRSSAGAATLSSHLMSPILTNSAGPNSRNGTNSPPEGERHIKIEGIESTPAGLPMHNMNHGHPDHAHGVQMTPTHTESSSSTSPKGPSVAPKIPRAASPIIRVDGFSRGDSPARSIGVLPKSGNKRSRRGSIASHLAVEQGEESEEEYSGECLRNTQDSSSKEELRSGLDPEQRLDIDNAEMPNLKEQEAKAQVDMKNIDVKEWLDRSEYGSSEHADAPPLRPAVLSKRLRAKSAGAQTLSQANLETFKASIADSNIPGPGVLINEESGDEDEDDYYDGIASIDDSLPPTDELEEAVNEQPGEAETGVYDELPNQPPLYRAKLWQDPLYESSNPGVKLQPITANDAMVRFQQRADNIETMSRVATWGTRRASDSDLRSLFHNLSFRETPQEQAGAKRERRGSFLQQISEKFNHKKNTSSLKRQDSDKSLKSKEKPVRPSPLDHGRKDSTGSRKESLGSLNVPQAQTSGLKRMSSLSKRPKSPRINTGSAVAAMAFQTGALGAGGSVSATATSSPTEWPRNRAKSIKNRSNLSGIELQGPASASATELGLAGLWTKQVGPPMPTLAAPLQTEETLNSLVDGDEDDEDDGTEDHGVTMDLSIRPDPIIPTLEGFKKNIHQLNPRLPSFMFDRIAQEQLRRFKKLLDFKVKHAQALSLGECASGKHCTELGGEPTYLPAKSNGKEADLAHSGFSIAGVGHSDEEVNALAEGAVTPAQFPPGVPMPPVKRLPAEFECSLCFKVKKFQKPSDWSKHVHEDVQPFTCTFPTCAEPKSFKRKADWVRHENERHRQLEWWMCNMNDCAHKCYRKDNFVQHLVREHKLPEPKVKTLKNGKPAVRGPSSQKARNKHADDTEESNDEIDQVWKLVDECRHETPKSPKDEACKFCGNICNSWKKLTVHLAKHMEQISMPILTIVKQWEITPETVISPIEQRINSQQPSLSPTAQSPYTPGGYASSMQSYGMTPIHSQTRLMGTMTPERQPTNNHHRISPHTYPPPSHAQQSTAGFNQRNGANLHTLGYSSHGNDSSGAQFNPVNVNTGLQYPTASSPDGFYGGTTRAPTSQPQGAGYGNSSRNQFQYTSQQQQAFSNSMGAPSYQMYNATPTSYPQPHVQMPTSFPVQQHVETPPAYTVQAASMHEQVPVMYNQMGQTQNFDQLNGAAPLYNQHQQQQRLFGYGQQ